MRLLAGLRAGRSGALVVRGEAGVGKSALLEFVVGRAAGCRVARAAGVQSEMELAFAGLHGLCGPMLDRLERLPGPQREALGTAFGLSSGAAPDRFLVGLAVLGLLAEVAEERPLVCVIDDAQWLDRASAQALAFVARRLGAEAVLLVFAVREPDETPELAGLPELAVEGLRDADARALLDSVIRGPLDERVRDRIVAETRGNPLAILELPRELSPAELAGGFALPDRSALPGAIEHSFQRRLAPLSPQTRWLMLIAAAEPLGDPLLVWRAADRLGIGVEAAAPAATAGLLELGAKVRFRHPLVRSAVYHAATPTERQRAHQALADATNPTSDPDRRAWHHAQATPTPDEHIAAELEHSATRAKARGGLAAAAAFLERASTLTPNRSHRAQRALAAATAKRDAGALEDALTLLATAATGPLNALQTAQLEHLRGQIAFDQRRGTDAPPLLLQAARHLEPHNTSLARETHLEALAAAMWAGSGVRASAQAARAAPPGPHPPRAIDALLDGFAARFIDGYTAAAPKLQHALDLLRDLDPDSDERAHWLWLTGPFNPGIAALEVWDDTSWYELTARQVRLARDAGALRQLQFALNYVAHAQVFAGRLTAAAALLEDDRAIAEATGNAPVAYSTVALAAWQGRPARAFALIEAVLRDAAAHGQGRMFAFATYAGAVLYNGLGRHDAALRRARRAFERDELGYGPLVVPELIEAASRTGQRRLVAAAVDWLSERARVTPTEWALGIEARARALLSEGKDAERHHRESIEHLDRCRLAAHQARAHLLYGEWLQRRRRRADARAELQIAHEQLIAIGAHAFAERAARGLLADGDIARKRRIDSRRRLTAQEMQIARLAREGLSNPQIAARVFISPRTVEYHLHKVFSKLGISSRNQLDSALDREAGAAHPAEAA